MTAASTNILDRPALKADERLWYGAHGVQFGDVWKPRGHGPFPLLIALHGGFWRAENDLHHLGYLCSALRDDGYVVFSVEYRRLGMAGVFASEMIDDVTAAILFATVNGASWRARPGPPVVLGHSAGGHLALMAATASELRGVVALAPITDLEAARSSGMNYGIVDQLFGPLATVDARFAATSPYERLPLGVAQVVVHGEEDRAVPVSMSSAYVARATSLGDPAELVRLPGAGHLDLIDPDSAAFGAVRRAVAACDQAIAAAPRRRTTEKS